MDPPRVKKRERDSHKGTYGRALIVAGSRGMSGAACLAGYSTVKAGAGLVTVAIPDCCLETVASYCPCYMTVPLRDDELGRIAIQSPRQRQALLDLCDKATSIGIGPGLSRSDMVSEIVQMIYQHCTQPMVVDADALNALAALPDGLSHAAGPRILTPHIGEFRRLVGDEALSADACRDLARQLAKAQQVIVVLKGHHTLVTDGTKDYESTLGNPGMATGGTGDVLTGIITALLGQDYSPVEATVLGVHAHGCAGDVALEIVGSELAVTAEDIVNALGSAFASLS